MTEPRAELTPDRAGAPAPGLARVLTSLLLFGVAFGYVEAAVVVYLRAAYEPLHERLYPREHGDPRLGGLLPFIPLQRMQSVGPAFVDWTTTELAREAATLLLLTAAALAVARNFRQWFAAFVLAFGLWDLFYYAFLKVLIDWPASPLTWDILFLVPVPWVAPVLAPALVALVMVVAGAVALWREAGGRPLRLTWAHWLALTAGALVIVATFCQDYRNVERGGLPGPFDWPLFAAGLLLGVAAFAHSLVAACGSADCQSAKPQAAILKSKNIS
jgi:hypothetical protein